MARDDFPKKTKEILAKRVGYRCSNPSCGCATVFPGKNDNKNVSVIGQAAHITAASPGGPRYDDNMTKEERSSVNNGIWLCNNCARLIDRNVSDISVETLIAWKAHAEEMQRMEIEGTISADTYSDRRLNIEKDFRDIHTYIVNNDMRKTSMDFFMLVDGLIEKYQSDSFFAHSSLLSILDKMAGLLSMETSPYSPPIPHDDPVMREILDCRKKFSTEYKRLFFL